MTQVTIKRSKKKAILFLISQCITLFGSTLVQMAVIWFVTLKTSSGAWIAAFTACSYIPQFIISFFGGVLADRNSRKWLIIISDGSIAVVTLIMMLVMPYIKSSPLLLCALLIMSVIRSFGAGIQTPAVNAVIPQLVDDGDLMRFNGLNATMQSVVQFAAPAAAGALMSIGTLRSTLLIDIATAAAGIGLLACIAIPGITEKAEKKPIFDDMKTGLKYSFSDPLLGRILVIFGLFIFLCVPAGFLAQLLVSRVYGDTYWYLTAVELVGFAGMTAGGLILSIKGGFKNRILTLSVGIAAFGLLAIGMGISRNFFLYLALMLLYGIALTTVQTATTTIIQENSDSSMQGRVFGLLGAMYSGFLPVGMAVFGPLADVIPLQYIMIFSGLMLLLIVAYIGSGKRILQNKA